MNFLRNQEMRIRINPISASRVRFYIKNSLSSLYHNQFLGGARSEVQCMHRWKKALKPGLVKGRWTDEEDDTIINCIKAGVTKWSEIAERTSSSSSLYL